MSCSDEIQQLTGPMLKSVNWHGAGDWWRCKSVTARQWEVCFPLNHDNRPRSLFFPFVQPLAFAFGLREVSGCMQWWWHLDDWWPVTLWWLLFCWKSVTRPQCEKWKSVTRPHIEELVWHSTTYNRLPRFSSFCSNLFGGVEIFLSEYSLRSMLLPSTILIPRNTLKYHDTFVSPAIY